MTKEKKILNKHIDLKLFTNQHEKLEFWIIQAMNELTSSLKAELESLQSQLAKAEVDKQELLDGLESIINDVDSINDCGDIKFLKDIKTLAKQLTNKHGQI